MTHSCLQEEPADEKLIALEDLFRKTETSPHLYWLPLSDESVAAKQQLRASQGLARAAPKTEQIADQKPSTEPHVRDEGRDAKRRDDRHRDERPRERRSDRRH